MFLDHFSSIICIKSDDSVVDIKICPLKKRLLVVYPSLICIRDTESEDLSVLCEMSITKKFSDQNGYFSASSWISKGFFACLSTHGKIIVYSIINNRISLKTSKIPGNGSFYTCVDAFKGYIISGDDKGMIYIHSLESDALIIHRVSDIPIKKIGISLNYALVSCSDGTTLVFTLDSQIITNASYSLKISQIPIYSKIISVSPISDSFVVYDPHGYIVLSSFTGDRQNIPCKKRITQLILNNDGNLFYAFSNEDCGIFSRDIPKLRWFTTELSGIVFASVGKSRLFILSRQGLATVPLQSIDSNSKYPIVFSNRIVNEFRISSDGCSSIIHVLSDEYFNVIGNIEYVSHNGSLIAVAGRKKIAIINTQTGSMFIPIQPHQICTRGLAWWGKKLCVISFDSKTTKYSFIVLRIASFTSIEIEKMIELQGLPYEITNCNDCVLLSMSQCILLIRPDYSTQTLTVTDSRHSIYCSKFDSIIILEKNSNLSVHSKGNQRYIKDEVSSFYVDNQLGFIFIISNDVMYVSYLPSNDVFIFESIKDTVLSISPENFAFISINDSFQPKIISYYAKSINLLMEYDFQESSRISLSMNSHFEFHRLVTDLILMMLNKNQGELIVRFIRSIPEFSYINTAHETYGIFMGVRFESQKDQEIVFNESQLIHHKLSIKGDLTPIIVLIGQTEHYSYYFSAALHYLRNCNENRESIVKTISLFDSIIQTYDKNLQFIVFNNERINGPDFVKLIHDFESSIIVFVSILMQKMRIDLVLCVLDLLKKGEKQILLKLHEFDSECPVEYILDITAPIISKHGIEKDLIRDLITRFNSADLIHWTIGLHLIIGQYSQTKKLLNDYPQIKASIRSTHWSHLIDS